MTRSTDLRRALRPQRAGFTGPARQKGDYDEIHEQLQVVPDSCVGMALGYFRA
jgi:hypothetical protein